MRKRSLSRGATEAPAIFHEANDRRHNAALDRSLEAARTALAALEALPETTGPAEAASRALWFDVLFLRVEHPDEPLSALARRAGVSKAAYAGRLRRALGARAWQSAS